MAAAAAAIAVNANDAAAGHAREGEDDDSGGGGAGGATEGAMAVTPLDMRRSGADDADDDPALPFANVSRSSVAERPPQAVASPTVHSNNEHLPQLRHHHDGADAASDEPGEEVSNETNPLADIPRARSEPMIVPIDAKGDDTDGASCVADVTSNYGTQDDLEDEEDGEFSSVNVLVAAPAPPLESSPSEDPVTPDAADRRRQLLANASLAGKTVAGGQDSQQQRIPPRPYMPLRCDAAAIQQWMSALIPSSTSDLITCSA